MLLVNLFAKLRSKTAKSRQFFLSDGLTEQFIDHEYFDAHAGLSHRVKIFEVDDVHFAANATKNLFVSLNTLPYRQLADA